MQISEEMVGCKFKLNSLEEEGEKNVLALINDHIWGWPLQGGPRGQLKSSRFSSPSWPVCSLIGSILNTGPFHGGGKRATSGFSLIFSQFSNSS